MGYFFAALNWLFVDGVQDNKKQKKYDGESFRRSFAMILVNMLEVGLFFSIVDFLWTSPNIHSSVWFAVKDNIYKIFKLEHIKGLLNADLIISLADIQIVISWFLYAVILTNVVGGIRRTEKSKKNKINNNQNS